MPAKSADDHVISFQIVVHASIKVIHWSIEVTIPCASIMASTVPKIKTSVFCLVIMIAPNSSDVIIRITECCYWIIPTVDVTSVVTMSTSSGVTAAVAIILYSIFSFIVMMSPYTIYGLSGRAYKIMVCIITIAGRQFCLRNQCRC